MELAKQTIEVPLNQGLDTKTDPKQLKIGKLEDLRNLVFTELGDLSPRNGYLALSQSILGGGSINAGLALATLASSLVLANGQNLYSYSESQSSWDAKGLKEVMSHTVYPVTGAATNVSVQDSAQHSGGMALFSWIDSSTSLASYAVLDTQTQAVSVAQAGSFTATNAKPVVIGSNSSFTLFLQNAGNIQYSSVALATPSSPTAASNLITITSGSAPFDVCTGNNSAYIFYVNGAGNIAFSQINSSNAVASTVTLSGGATCLSCWYDTTNNYVWLLWWDGTNVRYAVYTSAMVQVRAATTIVAESSVARLTGQTGSGTTGTIFYEVAGSTPDLSYIKSYTITTGGTATSISTLRSVGLAGHAFTYNSRVYAIAIHDTDEQATYFVIRNTGFNSYAQGTVIGKLAPLNAGGTPSIKQTPAVYSTSSGIFQFPYLIKANTSSVNGTVTSTLTLQSALIDFTQGPAKSTLGNTLFLGGSLVTGYDSASSTEFGFNLYPEGGSSYQPLTIGGLENEGVYSYKFTYEWIDEFGQTHRSAPSTGLQRTVEPIAIRVSGSVNNSEDIAVNYDGGNSPCRFVYVGASLSDSFTHFAAGTTIASITDDDTIGITPNSGGGVHSLPAVMSSRKTFSYVVSAGSGNLLGVTKPTALIVDAKMTSGSPIIFAAVTSGLANGQAIADNTGDIPGGTTISSFVYKDGGAYITMSNNAGATYSSALVTITHATGWPLTQWMHVGQVITGSGIPANTEISDIDDTNGTITVSQSIPATASGTLVISGYYTSRLELPTLRLTEKGRATRAVQIAVWRTTNGGTQYYKVGYAYNDSTVDTVPFYDYCSDDELVGNTQLYTNGGEVENIAPPPSNFMTTFKNRVILLPSEDGYAWWYSKQVVTGAPPEFSDLFQQAIDQRGGTLKAAAPMDDKLILFKQQDIFFVVGDGPSASGANNDFSFPQQITSPCGCTEPKSVITIPAGVMFKGSMGFFLLDRGLNVSYIGAEVEDFNSITVTSASKVANTTQVRFTLSNGTALMYDYLVGQWSVFNNVSAADSALYGSTYVYMSSAGLVLRETPGAYSDNGSVITTSFKTGWISLAKLQGFMRLWKTLLLGKWLSAHTLTFSAAQDFNETLTQTSTVTADSNPNPYQMRFGMTVQKCEAVQFTVTCTPSSTGGGASFSGLGFEVGLKKGLKKLPASKSYG